MLSLYRNFTIIFIYFAALQLKAVKDERIIRTLEVVCKSVQQQTLNFTQCKVEYVGRDFSEVTIAISLYQRPINNATVVGSIVKRGHENRQSIVDYKIDWCDFFRFKRRKFVAMRAYQIAGLEKYSNINHTCPYDDLLIDHYPFNGQAMGKLLPLGNGVYTFSTKLYIYNILTANVIIRFQVFER